MMTKDQVDPKGKLAKVNSRTSMNISVNQSVVGCSGCNFCLNLVPHLVGLHWVLVDLPSSPPFLPTNFQSVAPANKRVPPSS